MNAPYQPKQTSDPSEWERQTAGDPDAVSQYVAMQQQLEDARNTLHRLCRYVPPVDKFTGIGLVCPLGKGVGPVWSALLEGRSGIGPITRFDCDDFPTRIAGEVKDFNPTDWLERRDVKKMDTFIHYAVAAARMATDDSGLGIDSSNA